ncbi:NAD(P)H-dependent glycerol-3-phosphate dehydrogenase [Flavitalea sp.]|nr:NAD(P)H-dependent glycerol-3-phosphate dehydrogenase [Flavitalea sp.]
MKIKFGLVGSGTWATAIAKMLTGNGHALNWCVRDQSTVDYLVARRHNPKYLSSVHFEMGLLNLMTDFRKLIDESEVIILAVPSAYVEEYFNGLEHGALVHKKIVSAIKGIIPSSNKLVNDFLRERFNLPLTDYFTIMGPCHAEEVAAEKLSYLTFSGADIETCKTIAQHFNSGYVNTVVNNDVYGVQYAAVLKNIYALGAGIAHGLEYGDNFQSVLIANCADEMAGFLKKAGIQHIEVGVHEEEDPVTHVKNTSYAASVYLGDLLVTCYSLYSRNRTFGNMIGKGYSVKSAQLELNMVAEGYNAAKCIHLLNSKLGAEMPIASTIYEILWENVNPRSGYKQMEAVLV